MQEDIYKIINEKLKLKPIIEYSLTYDSPAQQLEPIYFWLLDFTRDLGFKVEKLIDNFTASPGSGYFAEIGRRATVMQEQAMKYLGLINQIIRSIINLLWDLKEFEIRLKLYDALKSKDEKERLAALNALKEIWISRVDIQKGRGAINMLTQQLEFVTLRDAFFVAKTLEDVDKLDLNERVKNILRSRLIEFNEWLKRSEAELRNRFKIEKTYLKSQVASLKLYARWARPYIKAAEELLMKEGKSADIVSIFSTMLLNLLLLCKKEYSPDELPKTLKREGVRNFIGVVLIDFSFRSIPSIAGKESYYVFGGRVDLNFKSYVFREDEFDNFIKEYESKEIEEVLKLSQDVTEETLKVLADDLKRFLEEGEKGEEGKDKENKEKKRSLKGMNEGIITDIINIFKGIFKGLFSGSKEKGKDTYEEEVLRKIAEADIKKMCSKIYDTFKKSHGMPSKSIEE